MPRKPRRSRTAPTCQSHPARRRPLFLEPLEERRLLAIDALQIGDVNLAGDSLASGFVPHGGFTYFNADDGVTEFELWRTDGTTASLFADIHPTGSSNPRLLTVASGKLFFTATTATTAATGREVWVTDGATAPQVLEVKPGNGGSNPLGLIHFNGELYFAADNGTGLGLWHTDGIAPPVSSPAPRG